MESKNKKLLIIDGNSILNRAYYGIRQLNAPDGTPTNAVYGFLNILFKYLEDETPDYLCVAFDLKSPTFRHKMYKEYKAQRKPAPDDFVVQIPIIKEILNAMDCTCIELEGYEADDIIGTVSSRCDENNIKCSILTGDKDDLQLASKNTTIKLVITRMGKTTTTPYDEDAVIENLGIMPSEFIDVKGLMGDTSDNIPGVKGIGEKTAFSLIKNYKSIENIYENIDDIDVTPSVRKKLIDGRDMAFMSKELATIIRNVPIDINFDEYVQKNQNDEKLSELFTKLNFKSFLKKLDLSEKAAQTKAVKQINAQEEKMATSKAYELIKEKGMISYVLNDDLSKIFFVTDDAENTDDVTNMTVFSAETDKDFLKNVFEDENIKKIGYDLKSDILCLNEKFDIDYEGLMFDTMIAAYINNPSRSKYELEDLCFEFLGLVTDKNSGKEDVQLSFDAMDNNASEYKNRLAAVVGLNKYFKAEIEKNGQEKLFYDIEMPMVKVLAAMQIEGVYVDKDELESFGKMLKENISDITSLIYEAAGEEFNINSPQQLGHVLFETLSLPHGKKTKRGYSTSADVLEKLLGVHPIIEHILSYRTLTKLNSTYVDGLLNVIDKADGRIHSSFNQTVTATGRISSTEPNLQNIPVRTELGREIRKMFASQGDDKILIDADYSQIELRVLSAISGDKNMCEAFRENKDIHTQTASQVFGLSENEVSHDMRSRAKAVNFGIVYGIGAYSLAQDLKITRKEADDYIKGYLSHYTGVDEYMKDILIKAREDGYVSTIYNRRRYIPELKATNKMTQAFGERVARNAPIQGTAADIIKIAMVNVYNRLKNEGLKSKLILQVHDELIIEATLDEKEKVENLLREEMQNAVELSVPLPVDLNCGRSWYDTK